MLIAFCGGSIDELIQSRDALGKFCKNNMIGINVLLFENWKDAITRISDLKMICIDSSNWEDAYMIFEDAILSLGLGKSEDIIILNRTTFPLKQDNMIQMIRLLISYFGNLKIPIKEGFKLVPVNEILFFENVNRKVFVKTNKEYFETRLSLKDVSNITKGMDFYSPYVSFYVNFSQIDSIKSNNIKLRNNDVIPISQKRASMFRKEYISYMENHINLH